MDDKKLKSFLEQAALVIGQVKRCRETGIEGVSGDQIDYVLDQLEEMKEAVTVGALPPRADRYKLLTRLVVDEWPLGHPIGTTVSELEETYYRL